MNLSKYVYMHCGLGLKSFLSLHLMWTPPGWKFLIYHQFQNTEVFLKSEKII